MPKYKFRCKACEEEFTKITHGNPTIFSCPECGADDIEKTMPTSIGIRFEGDGFYRTDYGEEE